MCTQNGGNVLYTVVCKPGWPFCGTRVDCITNYVDILYGLSR